MEQYSVIIADDEAPARLLIQKILNMKFPHAQIVKICVNGQTVIDYLADNKNVDIVIVDINMPLKTGIDIARYIKENNLDTDVVLVSGYKDFEYARQAINLGVSRFVSKPIQIAEFVDCIQNIFNRRRESVVREIEQSAEFVRIWNAERSKLKLYYKKIHSLKDTNLRDEFESLKFNHCAVVLFKCVTPLFYASDLISHWRDLCEDDNERFCAFCMEETEKSAVFLFLSKEKETSSVEQSVRSFCDNSVKMMAGGNLDIQIRYSWELFSTLANIQSRNQSNGIVGVSAVVQRAEQYILEHYSENLSLRDIADKSKVSYSYLSREFKRETGINFVDYLSKIRIEKAKELLKAKSGTVKYVANTVGYNDIHYFIKVFSDFTGQTPKRFSESVGMLDVEDVSDE